MVICMVVVVMVMVTAIVITVGLIKEKDFWWVGAVVIKEAITSYVYIGLVNLTICPCVNSVYQ